MTKNKLEVKYQRPQTVDGIAAEAIEALRVLVAAKTEKELLGKTAEYEKLRTRGWQLAKTVLALADNWEQKGTKIIYDSSTKRS